MTTTNTLTLDSFMQPRLGKLAEVYLVVGIRLSGVLIAYDQEAIFIRAPGKPVQPMRMVLWSAVTSVSIPGEEGGDWQAKSAADA